MTRTTSLIRLGSPCGCLIAPLCHRNSVSAVAGALILTARTKAKERQTRLDQRLQAIRAAGQPLTEGDLLRMFPDPPPERDADRILKDSLNHLAIPEEPTNLPFFSEASLPHSGEQRWRLDSGGGLPEKLSDLAPTYLPALPIDPFYDLPFHYRRLSQGYVVYSVGPDFVDDGGKGRSSNEGQSNHYDISLYGGTVAGCK